jgi:hypothetical protein
MLRDLKDSEKTTDLLVKAALTPYALTRAERKAYNRIIAARSSGLGPLSPGEPAASMHAHRHGGDQPTMRPLSLDSQAALHYECDVATLRKQFSASDLTGF